MTGNSDQKPLRILVNALHAKTGGGITYIRNMVPLLARVPDVDLHVCIHETQDGLLPSDLEGVTIHRMGFLTGFWRLLFREQTDLPGLAKQIRAEVVFSPANYGPLFVPRSVILLRNALSVALVERRLGKLLYWAAVYFGTALSLLRCRQAITVSDYALRSLGWPLSSWALPKVTVVPHGASRLFTQEGGLTEVAREPFLLSVSDIYVQKNLRNLVLAFERIAARKPDLALRVAGRPVDAPYFESIRNLVREKGLENRVQFLGHRSPQELLDLYQRCSLFVFPSVVETFGNPLVEAMACGTPIACSDTSAMPEVVGDSAAYFNPADIEDMANTIEMLLNDSEMRQRLGEQARERVKRYSWNRTAEQTLSVLRQAALG